MPTITNKTRLPLTVPLPGGKKLRLGPGNTGQVTPKALAFPPVKKLVEAGDVEVAGDDRKHGGGQSGAGKGRAPGRGPTTGGVRHTGDR